MERDEEGENTEREEVEWEEVEIAEVGYLSAGCIGVTRVRNWMDWSRKGVVGVGSMANGGDALAPTSWGHGADRHQHTVTQEHGCGAFGIRVHLDHPHVTVI